MQAAAYAWRLRMLFYTCDEAIKTGRFSELPNPRLHDVEAHLASVHLTSVAGKSSGGHERARGQDETNTSIRIGEMEAPVRVTFAAVP